MKSLLSVLLIVFIYFHCFAKRVTCNGTENEFVHGGRTLENFISFQEEEVKETVALEVRQLNYGSNGRSDSDKDISRLRRDTGRFTVFRDGNIDTKSFKWDSENVTNISDMRVLLDMLDPYRVLQDWARLKGRLGEQCLDAMDVYLTALNKSETWAVKVWDATGRFNSGFFWGNGYWMGSQAECFAVEKSAPFPMGFSVIKLLIHLPPELAVNAHQVQVGLCLPYNCTTDDVRAVAETSVPPWAELLKVRSLQQGYDFWRDPVFWILVCVTTCVFLMLFIGTAYDLYLGNTNSRASLSTSNGQSKMESEPGAGIAEVNLNGHEPVQRETTKRHSVIKALCQKAPGILPRILLSFSVKSNLQIICDPNVGVDTIPTIHGLRFLSMLWVILGHTSVIIFEYSDNRAFRAVMEEKVIFQTVSKATFSVDTFFFISGLLVSFLYFRTMAKVDITKFTKSTGVTSNIMQFVGLLVYRYLRLTVTYMFVLGVVLVSMRWFQHTSVFEAPFNDHVNCEKYWWRNVLYINNFFSANDMCMLWSWYLADDTQFYVLGAVLLVLATSYFRLAAVILGLFLATSSFTAAFVAYSNNHMPGSDDPLALFDSVYDKPWTRLGPYLIGMCVGWILYRTDCKINMNKLVVVIGWLSSTAGALFLVYGLHKVKMHPLTAAAYSSLSHSFWALVLAWIVVACSTGYGGYVNKLLSLSIIHPFSRVTYCAYLVHPLIVQVLPTRIDGPFHLVTETAALLFFGQVVISYMLAFIVSIMFEAPVVSLLKILSPSKDGIPKNEDDKLSTNNSERFCSSESHESSRGIHIISR